jgi:hypothetical protein
MGTLGSSLEGKLRLLNTGLGPHSLLWTHTVPDSGRDGSGLHLPVVSPRRSLGSGLTISRAPGGPGRGPELPGAHGGP